MTKAWWLVVVCAVSPLACAQIAGIDNKFSAAGDDDDAGSDVGFDAAADAAAFEDATADAAAAEDAARNACRDLNAEKNECAACVVKASTSNKCRSVCFLDAALLKTYLDCLATSREPRDCEKIYEERPGVAEEQRDCISECVKSGDCDRAK